MSEGKGDMNPARIWEFLMKASVPISFIVAGSLIRAEIKNATQDERMNQLDKETARVATITERQAEPPAWLREQIAEIKSRLDKIDDRMAVRNRQEAPK